MRRIIGLLILICLLCGAVTATASCALFAKRIDSGTEGAKLLNATERLDESVLDTKLDFGFAAEKAKGVKALASSVRHSPSVNDAFCVDPSLAYVDKEERHTWTDFPAHSRSEIEFTQFIKGVEHEVNYVAEDIANMKNNVGVTDNWVKIGFELQMLRVFDSYDVLFVIGQYEDVHVYYRYTDESAKNVYEMYSFMKYDDGTTGNIRTLCTPGERYEYMYENSGGFSDYFIAENSRGFWVNTRFGFVESPEITSANYSSYIIRNGIGIGVSVYMENDVQLSSGFNIFDPASKRELCSVGFIGSDYGFGISLCNINEGLVSVSSDFVTHDDEENIYTTNRINTLVTSKGTYTASRDSNFTGFCFEGGSVYYDYAEKVHEGELLFTLCSPKITIEEALLRLEEHLGSMGLTLHVGMNEVASVFEHALLHADTFTENFLWNGYNATSFANVKKSREVLLEDYRSAMADYERIKDNPTQSGYQRLSEDADFADISITAGGNNTYSGGKIVIDGITASASDLRLFEQGLGYVLKVAISRLDEDGNPISVNTVALGGGAESAVTFNGSSISLSAGGEFEVPRNMASGSYAAVVYIATEDEGIRVSKMQKISFITVAGGNIESSAMDIEAIEQSKSLIVKYDIKNKRYITEKLEGGSASYEQVQRIFLLEILAYGAPMHNAAIETEDGKAVDRGYAFKRGTYRMKCYLNTADGLAESYVYLSIE